jgi:hypothetical protein
MRPIKFLFSPIVALTLLSGCVEPFYPKEIAELPIKYVVSGKVTNNSGYQYVNVSVNSPITNPRIKPVANCQVKIVDANNNVFTCGTQGVGGVYPVWIGAEHLYAGNAFMVEVTLPNGSIIESSFDTLQFCPPIDSVYYVRQNKPTSDPGYFEKGIQFKVNLNASDQYSRYYKYEVEETFEHHSQYPITLYYDGSLHQVSPPDYSLFYCWQTHKINSIYTLSTGGLEGNSYEGLNLHFVNNRTQRLVHQYSIKVTQLALSRTTYYYWEQLRINSSEQGGMFDSQPISIKGNLRSSSNPDMVILGNFGTSAEVSKRFFFSSISNLDFELIDVCSPTTLDMGFSIFSPDEFPVYVVRIDGVIYYAEKSCFDCITAGGTTVKPSFWPY